MCEGSVAAPSREESRVCRVKGPTSWTHSAGRGGPWKGLVKERFISLGSSSGFHPRVILPPCPPRGHLAMTTDIFGCHNLENESSI